MARRRHRRRNPRRWPLVLGAIVLVGVGYLVGRYRARRRAPALAGAPAPAPPLPVPSPEGVAEPVEGWDVRWAARRGDAIDTCRDDAEVTTWSQMVACALATAFPEAAPWTTPDTWAPWQQDAAAFVTDDLRAEAGTAFDTTDPTPWQVLMWLLADRYATQCHSQGVGQDGLAGCVAGAIYPDRVWPPEPDAEWEAEFWAAVVEFTQGWEPPVAFAPPAAGGGIVFAGD